MTHLAALRKCLAGIDRPLTFCASATAAPILPGLRVDRIGMIALPVDTAQADALAVQGTLAGYGRGTRTEVDPTVRSVLRFPPERVTLENPAWENTLSALVTQVAGDLGLEGRGLVAVLHELLLYRPGDFFRAHQDGEKMPGMVATLSVQLPSRCTGGAVVVRHQGNEVRLPVDDPAMTFVPHAIGWYADCAHEILPVTTGHRLVLIYNLILPAGNPAVQAPDFGNEVTTLTKQLRLWQRSKTAGAGPLVIPLAHAYSSDGLSPAWLKGRDQAQASALFKAAADAGLESYLALVTHRVVGETSDDDDDVDPEDMEMGYIIDDHLYADRWVDAAGAPLPLGEVSLSREDFLDGYEAMHEQVSEQEYVGYTGNACLPTIRMAA